MILFILILWGAGSSFSDTSFSARQPVMLYILCPGGRGRLIKKNDIAGNRGQEKTTSTRLPPAAKWNSGALVRGRSSKETPSVRKESRKESTCADMHVCLHRCTRKWAARPRVSLCGGGSPAFQFPQPPTPSARDLSACSLFISTHFLAKNFTSISPHLSILH